MTARPRLRTLELTGYRATIRRAAFITIIASAILGAIAYALPAHRLEYVPSSGGWLDLAAQSGDANFHSLLDDGSPMSILVLLAAAGFAALLMRSRRLGTGMLAGLLGAASAILAILPIILVHLFSRYESAIGEHAFAVAELVLFFVGALFILLEPVLYLLERRRIERASRPAPLPVATALAPATGAR